MNEADIERFISSALERLPYPPVNKARPLCAMLYCPREHVEIVNRQINAAWGDSGDNLSRELSPTGRNPWTYKSGNYAAIALGELRDLAKIFSKFPGSVCVLAAVGSGEQEVVAVFGMDGSRIVGSRETWRSTGEILLGVKPSDEFYWRLAGSPIDIVLQTVILPERPDAQGMLVSSLADPWSEIAAALEKNPELLFEFKSYSRKFEEFIASTYSRAGYEVILTPHKGDGGRDVIATKNGFGAVRLQVQAKAYRSDCFVENETVDAMIGVIRKYDNTSKGIITTTSSFRPSVFIDPDIQKFIPYRLELVDGKRLRDWILSLK
ncbi:MAG: restriction endonuclease [Rhizobiaceae bacterium]